MHPLLPAQLPFSLTPRRSPRPFAHYADRSAPTDAQQSHLVTRTRHTGGQSLAFPFPADQPASLLNVVETNEEAREKSTE